MDSQQIKRELKNSKYNFLRTNPHLGYNIVLLGLSGSHAYGTSIDSSDLDIRGIALNNSREILLGQDFEQVTGPENTDVCVYSFMKMMRLLAECNPNCIEILGLKPEHYLYISPIGNLLLENKDMFLSKRAAYTYGGYIHSQMRHLEKFVDNPAPRPEKLCKTMMQIERLADMCCDLLEKGEINTYRGAQREKYLAIRSGKYLAADNSVKPEFFNRVQRRKMQIKELAETSPLPTEPDWARIQNFICDINKRIVNEEV